MRAFLVRLLGLFRRSGSEFDFDAELQSHLQHHIDDNLRAGMSESEARRQALLKLGGVDSVKENWRDRRGFPGVESLVRDVRHAVRMLARNPGFTAAAALSLALGIGANTAIFSVADAMLLRSLPVQNPGELVIFAGWDPGIHTWMYNYTWRELQELRRRLSSFSGITSSWTTDRPGVLVNGRVDETRTHIGIISGNYFQVLGVAPVIGRSFDDREPAVIISHTWWERHFALAPDVLGRTLVMNGTVLTIVGVAPRSFTGDQVGQPMDLWIPAAMAPRAVSRWPQRLESNPLRIIARLRPGITARQAEAEARPVYSQLARELRLGPGQSAPSHGGIFLLPEGQGISRPRAHYQRPIIILTIVAGLVLLIACANAANLFLTRSEARRKEIAIRLALGAGRGRIMRQLLLESIVVALPAGAAGLVLAWWGTGALAQVARYGPWAVDLNLTPDTRMLFYTAILCVLTGILFGLAPALAASKVELYAAVKGAVNGPGRFRLGKSLVVVQVALALVLLFGAGLFVRTLHNLKSQDVGFQHDHLLVVRTDPGPRPQQPASDVYAQLGRIPGVRSVSASHFGLLLTAVFIEVNVPGYVARTPADSVVAADQITPRYLETLGIQLAAGREFTAQDMSDHPRVAVVNESMARRFFGRTDVVGRRFNWGEPSDPPLEIVGVARDAAYSTLREHSAAMVYLPDETDWQDLSDACLILRTAGDVPGLAGRVREELRVLAPGLTVHSIDWMDAEMDQSLAIERMVAWMAGLFGALALVLACVGLYGVMSYVAARRTSEIGIRVSLGATPFSITRLVLGDALFLAIAGIVLGVPAVLIGSRYIGALLFGIRGSDAATMVGSAVLLLAVATAAAWLPAWRASRMDPMKALRSE